MFQIYKFDFAEIDHFPVLENVKRENYNLVPVETTEPGVVRLPELNPLWISGSEGLELNQEDCLIAIWQANSPMVYSNGSWEVSSIGAVYYSVSDLRHSLKNFFGAISFQLQVTTPLTYLKVGYHTLGNPLNYLVQFGLPKILSTPIRLSRLVRSSPDGTSTPGPVGFRSDQISNLKVMPFGQVPLNATPTANPPRLVLERAVAPNTLVNLLFDYQVPVAYTYDDYQVNAIPIVVLRLLGKENQHRILVRDAVRIDDEHCLEQLSWTRFDQVIEWRVLVDEYNDLQRIGEALLEKMQNNSCLECPPFATSYYLQVTSGLEELNVKGAELINTDLTNAVGRLQLKNLTEGTRTIKRRIIDDITGESTAVQG